MKLGILCREKRIEIEEIEKLLKNNKIDTEILFLDQISLPAKKDLDYLIVRGGPGIKRIEDWNLLLSVIKNLESDGIKCINSSQVIENGMNKFLTYQLFKKNNIPTPETSLYHDVLSINKFPVVAKPVIGSEGEGVEKIKNKEELKQIKYRPVLIQEFIPHGGIDYRAYIVGDRVLGGIARRAKDGWITNLAKGGIPEKHILSKEEENIAKRAAAAINAEIATVDFVNLDGNIYVLEVNVLPLFSERLVEVTGFNLAEEIVKYFLERYM